MVAIDTNTGNAVVDALTNPDGSYRIAGVPPGSYDVLVLPLAPDADSGIYTLDNFGGWACGFGANVPPCCDPALSPACDTSGALKSPTNYTGTYH